MQIMTFFEINKYFYTKNTNFFNLITYFKTTIPFFFLLIVNFFIAIVYFDTTIVHFLIMTVYNHIDNSLNTDTKDKNKQHTFKPTRPSLRWQAHLQAHTSQRSNQRLTKEPASPSRPDAPRNGSTSIVNIAYI